MARIFRDCEEMVREIDRELAVSGITVPVKHYQNQELIGDDQNTKELSGVNFVISKPWLKKREMLDFLFKEEADNIEKYCEQEYLDRTSGEALNPGNSYKIRLDLWQAMMSKEDGERFDYCVTPGSRVLTIEGLKNIEDLKVSDLVYDKNGKIVEIKNFSHLKDRNILSLETNYGYKISGTYNHPLYGVKKRDIKKKNINPSWIRLDELEPGDYVSIFEKYLETEEMDNDILFLLGLIMSDGGRYYGRGSTLYYGFCNTNEKIIDEFEKICNKLNYSFGKNYNKKEKFWLIRLHTESSKKLEKYFDHFYNIFHNLSRDSVLEFLSGFIEGDGYYRKDNAKELAICCNPSHPYQEEIIRTLISKLGFLSSINYGKTTKIYIRGKEAKEIIKMIPSRIKEKPIYKSSNKYSKRFSFISSDGYRMIKIKDIWKDGKSDVYDISTEGNFICNGLIVHNTYSERINELKQLDNAINALKDDIHSRRSVISIWDPKDSCDIEGFNTRVPCSISYQFLIRNNKLMVIYYIRSNDYFKHFVIDIWLTHAIQEFVRQQLLEVYPNLKCGSLNYYAGSLHAYKEDLDKVIVY